MELSDRDSRKLELLLGAFNRVYPSLPNLLFRSFLTGIFTALGATLGLSIMIAVITFFIGQLKLVPVISDILSQTHIDQYVK